MSSATWARISSIIMLFSLYHNYSLSIFSYSFNQQVFMSLTLLEALSLTSWSLHSSGGRKTFYIQTYKQLNTVVTKATAEEKPEL